MLSTSVSSWVSKLLLKVLQSHQTPKLPQRGLSPESFPAQQATDHSGKPPSASFGGPTPFPPSRPTRSQPSLSLLGVHQRGGPLLNPTILSRPPPAWNNQAGSRERVAAPAPRASPPPQSPQLALSASGPRRRHCASEWAWQAGSAE